MKAVLLTLFWLAVTGAAILLFQSGFPASAGHISNDWTQSHSAFCAISGFVIAAVFNWWFFTKGRKY